MKAPYYRKVESCRVCKSHGLELYLDLGEIPLVNSLIEANDIEKKEPMFPLEVVYCGNCSLSQLSVVVDPKVMFSNYVYRSSISKTLQQHFSEMAKKMLDIFNSDSEILVVDIASNDGCLLRQFKMNGFNNVIGIEPAKNLADIANASEIKTINSFWAVDVAEEIKSKHGKAKVITATNVFAHVDNLHSFLEGIVILLDEDGLFIVEVPYLSDLIEKNEFDTIYHEHLSYFLLKPIKMLFEGFSLKVVGIDKHPIHGGTIRIYASKMDIKVNAHKSLGQFLEFEKDKGLYNIKTYKDLSKKVGKVKEGLLLILNRLKRENKKVAAYGASAKGNVLLNYCGINSSLIKFIVDDTPEKQNKLAPGSRIPIKDASILEREKPDYLVLLAWNFAEELMNKTKSHQERGGKYIIPIPEVKIS